MKKPPGKKTAVDDRYEGHAEGGAVPGKMTRAEKLPSDPVDRALTDLGNGRAHASGARLHTGPEAARAAAALGAEAFTAGSDVFFGAGSYRPGTAAGNSLIEHELSHVEQARGVEPPAPGRYDVAPSSDPAEAAARSGVAGAAASPRTIYRKEITSLRMRDPGGTDTGKTKGKGPDLELKPPEPMPDKIEELRRAVYRHDVAAAKNTWMLTPNRDRKIWAESAGFERELIVMHATLGSFVFSMMNQLGKSFTDLPALRESLLHDRDDKTVAAIVRHGLWSSFIAGLPKALEGTDRDAKEWWSVLKRARDKHEGKRIFEAMYPPLAETSYAPDTLQTTNWELGWIKRLYRALSQHLSINHVRSARAFHMGVKYRDSATDPWKHLDYAWWNSLSRNVVLPKASAGAGGGGKTHDMVGGGRSKIDPKDSSKKSDEKLTHFASSALHEIGHGVGQELGGDAWAKAYSGTNFTEHGDLDEWSKPLWGDDATLDARARSRVPKGTPILPSCEARKWLAHKIGGSAYEVSTPGFDDPAQVRAFVSSHYHDQKLVKYWKEGRIAKDRYLFSGENAIGNDGRVHVYWSRGTMRYVSYKKAAWEKKVSWYSLASYKEWFAEQYSAYYTSTPRGAGMSSDVKRKLDEIHGKKWKPDPRDAVMAPDFGDLEGSTAGGAGPMTASRGGDRLPFPW